MSECPASLIGHRLITVNGEATVPVKDTNGKRFASMMFCDRCHLVYWEYWNPEIEDDAKPV